ncbi:LuxR C-terminal-related transcriptional regulator [Shimia thalassica]|uniref:helix-turn-helix transcriptional regulator n=1 Tax=Shimia thalassica TaxID=1715693 RepID=UPI001C09E9CC|nr:LuxR C-terminal-related transcriptional regulator [Shimia thalassica]MBU2941433.1 LuxR C-terminal-related transcriptional regulator [Shimia thalassica]
MRLRLWPKKTRERRATVLAGLILLQALCAVFFIGDVIEDFREDWHLDNPHLLLESVAAVALIAGVIFLMIELRGLLSRMSDMQTGLEIANGHLAEVIQGFFEDWNLTNAERDVAIMILKGLDNEAIAQVRNTASGTVRAQATKIYAKSATDGRAQFISVFVEELLAGGISAESDLDSALKNKYKEKPATKDHFAG